MYIRTQRTLAVGVSENKGSDSIYIRNILLSLVMFLYMHGVCLTDITRLFLKSEFDLKEKTTTEKAIATEVVTVPVFEEVTINEVVTEMVIETEPITIAETEPVIDCPLSDHELRLFANVLDLEFNPDLGYDGAVITAIVIYNRVRSGNFPNSVEGVLYQSGQFSCIGSVTGNASDTAIQIVKDIYNGNYHGYDWLVDNGLYFCNQWCDFSSWATLVHEYWSGNFCVKVYK